MAKGKSGRKERERKRREENERIQRESELGSEDGASKSVIESNADIEEKELQRIETEKVHNEQKRETEQELANLSGDIGRAWQNRWQSQAWSKYLSCDGRPDIEDPRQVNAFISRWMDASSDVNRAEDPSAILQQCDEAARLVRELEELLQEARHLGDKTLEASTLLRTSLQVAINAKLDRATLAFLKTCSLHTDRESGNSYFYGRNEDVAMAVWSNLSCNSRYCGMDAKQMGVSVTVPRSLVIGEHAVRCVKSAVYDRNVRFGDFRLAPYTWCKIGVDTSAESSNETGVGEESEGGVGASGATVDMGEYVVVGSVISVDVLAIPPQPQTIKDWVITRLEKPDILRSIEWVSDFSSAIVEAEDDKPDDEEATREHEARIDCELRKLVFISFKLSEEVLWSDTPKLAVQGSDDDAWTTAGLHRITCREDNSEVSFYTTRFGTFACLQSRVGSFPYQSWDIVPGSLNERQYCALFTLCTMTVTLEIEIQAGRCVLRQVQSNDKCYLQSLCGQPVTPVYLFKRLQAAGIYVTPTARDQLYTSNIRRKDAELETIVYRQIAMNASAVVFSSSRWNASIGLDRFIVRVANPDHQLEKTKLPVILVTRDNATLLAIDELSQTFSERPFRDTPVVADLSHVVKPFRSPPIAPANDDPVFIDTVFRVLATCGVLRC